METLKVDYKSNSSELCEIGKKYDTDKSSQRRSNVTDERHCHPYTLFYEELFKHNKDNHFNIAEIGILHGASLLMWKDYFSNSHIYGFDNDNKLIDSFKQNFNNDRITLSTIDVTNKESISKAFSELNMLYDIIIEDTTHQFEDQINVIENVYPYLKPGGILIIENIFKSHNEKDYFHRLAPLLKEFQDYYFIELDHINKKSFDNDKLFVLIKGGEPIFKNIKLTLTSNLCEKNKWCILLTTAIALHDMEYRKELYLMQLEKWVTHTNYFIFIVESTGNGDFFNTIKDKYPGRIDIISIQLPPSPSTSILEAQSIKAAMNHILQTDITHILKVTGRYFLDDIQNSLENVIQNLDFYIQIHNNNNNNWQNTEYYGIRKNLMVPMVDTVIENKELMEHNFYKFIHQPQFKLTTLGPFPNNIRRGGDKMLIKKL